MPVPIPNTLFNPNGHKHGRRINVALGVTMAKHSLGWFVVAFCVSMQQAYAQGLRISDVKQGLMRFDHAGKGHIYSNGNQFDYIENGTCTANGDERPCMWHGFEFNFTATSDSTSLSCVSRLNPPMHIVDPASEYGRSVSVFNWSLELSGHSGTFTNPQYTYRTASTPWQHSNTLTTCSYDGQVVLRMEFTVNVAHNNVLQPTVQPLPRPAGD
jgi:hypothetical protein